MSDWRRTGSVPGYPTEASALNYCGLGANARVAYEGGSVAHEAIPLAYRG